MMTAVWLSLILRLLSSSLLAVHPDLVSIPPLRRQLRATDVTSSNVPYTIRVWDKNGDLLINGQQCPAANASQCYWYYCDVLQGVQTRVSNTSTLDLRAQFSEYGEYYLMNQNRSIVEYALVVPNADAAAPFESNFLSLHPCHTGIPNSIGFRYTSNINITAIDSEQPCDLRWNGLPHCAFTDTDKLCYYNSIDLMSNFSVQCRLDYERDIYISSIPKKIGQVDNLPSCPPSKVTSNITYENITVSSTIATPTITVPTNITQPAPTNAADITSTTSMINTPSSTAHVTYTTVTSTVIATPVHSGSATINATRETSTPISSPSETTSEQGTNTIIIVAAVCAVIIAVIILFLILLIMTVKVYSRRRARKGRSNSNTENNIELQPRWKQEIRNNQVNMAESLTTIITSVLWHLRPLLSYFEYNEINSMTNEMRKAYALLNTICSREDDKLVIKLCDALEEERHHRWTYLRDYCNSNNTENYDV